MIFWKNHVFTNTFISSPLTPILKVELAKFFDMSPPKATLVKGGMGEITGL